VCKTAESAAHNYVPAGAAGRGILTATGIRQAGIFANVSFLEHAYSLSLHKKRLIFNTCCRILDAFQIFWTRTVSIAVPEESKNHFVIYKRHV
jgi:hypothetical protein